MSSIVPRAPESRCRIARRAAPRLRRAGELNTEGALQSRRSGQATSRITSSPRKMPSTSASPSADRCSFTNSSLGRRQDRKGDEGPGRGAGLGKCRWPERHHRRIISLHGRPEPKTHQRAPREPIGPFSAMSRTACAPRIDLRIRRHVFHCLTKNSNAAASLLDLSLFVVSTTMVTPVGRL